LALASQAADEVLACGIGKGVVAGGTFEGAHGLPVGSDPVARVRSRSALRRPSRASPGTSGSPLSQIAWAHTKAVAVRPPVGVTKGTALPFYLLP